MEHGNDDNVTLCLGAFKVPNDAAFTINSKIMNQIRILPIKTIIHEVCPPELKYGEWAGRVKNTRQVEPPCWI